MPEDVFHPTVEDFRAARERIKTCIALTPLLRADGLQRNGRHVFIKPENLQRTGSFKVRGAFNALASMTPEQRAKGVVTFSSGNHGTAVAFAARELGLREQNQSYPCTVVMPERASPTKVANIQALGAEIVFHGATVADRRAKAEEIATSGSREVIPSYDDRRVICGQGSLGSEIMDQWMGLPARTRRLYMVVGPVGGGGLMAGVSAALRARGFSGRVIGVEPNDANDTQQSLAKGERVSIDPPMTICDGLRSTTPGALTFPILRKCLESIVTVSDDQVRAAMGFLLSDMKLLVEPSGAVAIAAWMAGLLDNGDHDPKSPEYGGDVILIVSGGNVDPKLALSWIQ
jgi:threonine dehydratase